MTTLSGQSSGRTGGAWVDSCPCERAGQTRHNAIDTAIDAALTRWIDSLETRPVPRSTKAVRIAPSVLSADFGRLAEEIVAIERAGADLVHVDVMDGRFVPNITIGPVVVRAIRAATKLPLDVHLMIENPERYVEAFAQAGADILTVHAEASPHLERTCAHIRSLGKRAGVSLNPHSHESVLEYALHTIDLVLLMTVNPGFGGQDFMSAVVPKITRVREMLDAAKCPADLEVDGGIRPGTARIVKDAGADVLVAGNAVFQGPDYQVAIDRLRND